MEQQGLTDRESFTSLMKKRYGMTKKSTSLKLTPNDNLFTAMRKVADFIAKNGEWTTEDEVSAVRNIMNNYINQRNETIQEIIPMTFEEFKNDNDNKVGSFFLSSSMGKFSFCKTITTKENGTQQIYFYSLDPEGKTHKTATSFHYYKGFSENVLFGTGERGRRIGYDKLMADIEQKAQLEDFSKAESERLRNLMRALQIPNFSSKRLAYYFEKEEEGTYTDEYLATLPKAEDHEWSASTKEEKDRPWKLQNDWGGTHFIYPSRVQEARVHNKAITFLQNYLEETYSYALQQRYEQDIEKAQRATVYQTKKNINQATQERMENSALNDWFSYVEIDNDVELDKFDLFEKEMERVRAILPTTDVTPDLRLRKLGNHKALGIFFPTINTICIDFRDYSSEESINGIGVQSFVHEYGHFLDYTTQKDGQMLSMTSAFRPIVQRYRANYHGDKSDYYGTPTEVFARAFEIYCSDCGLSSSLLKDPQKYALDSIHGEYRAFDETMREELATYFDTQFPDLKEKIQALEEVQIHETLNDLQAEQTEPILKVSDSVPSKEEPKEESKEESKEEQVELFPKNEWEFEIKDPNYTQNSSISSFYSDVRFNSGIGTIDLQTGKTIKKEDISSLSWAKAIAQAVYFDPYADTRKYYRAEKFVGGSLAPDVVQSWLENNTNLSDDFNYNPKGFRKILEETYNFSSTLPIPTYHYVDGELKKRTTAELKTIKDRLEYEYNEYVRRYPTPISLETILKTKEALEKDLAYQKKLKARNKADHPAKPLKKTSYYSRMLGNKGSRLSDIFNCHNELFPEDSLDFGGNWEGFVIENELTTLIANDFDKIERLKTALDVVQVLENATLKEVPYGSKRDEWRYVYENYVKEKEEPKEELEGEKMAEEVTNENVKDELTEEQQKLDIALREFGNAELLNRKEDLHRWFKEVYGKTTEELRNAENPLGMKPLPFAMDENILGVYEEFMERYFPKLTEEQLKAIEIFEDTDLEVQVNFIENLWLNHLEYAGTYSNDFDVPSDEDKEALKEAIVEAGDEIDDRIFLQNLYNARYDQEQLVADFIKELHEGNWELDQLVEFSRQQETPTFDFEKIVQEVFEKTSDWSDYSLEEAYDKLREDVWDQKYAYATEETLDQFEQKYQDYFFANYEARELNEEVYEKFARLYRENKKEIEEAAWENVKKELVDFVEQIQENPEVEKIEFFDSNRNQAKNMQELLEIDDHYSLIVTKTNGEVGSIEVSPYNDTLSENVIDWTVNVDKLVAPLVDKKPEVVYIQPKNPDYDVSGHNHTFNGYDVTFDIFDEETKNIIVQLWKEDEDYFNLLPEYTIEYTQDLERINVDGHEKYIGEFIRDELIPMQEHLLPTLKEIVANLNPNVEKEQWQLKNAEFIYNPDYYSAEGYGFDPTLQLTFENAKGEEKHASGNFRNHLYIDSLSGVYQSNDSDSLPIYKGRGLVGVSDQVNIDDDELFDFDSYNSSLDKKDFIFTEAEKEKIISAFRKIDGTQVFLVDIFPDTAEYEMAEEVVKEEKEKENKENYQSPEELSDNFLTQAKQVYNGSKHVYLQKAKIDGEHTLQLEILADEEHEIEGQPWNVQILNRYGTSLGVVDFGLGKHFSEEFLDGIFLNQFIEADKGTYYDFTDLLSPIQSWEKLVAELEADFVFDPQTKRIDGVVNGKNLSDVEWYGEVANEFDLEHLSDEELSVFKYNVLAQAKDTWTQITEMEDDDKDLEYWQEDFLHEDITFIGIENEMLKRRLITRPQKLAELVEAHDIDETLKELRKAFPEKALEEANREISQDNEETKNPSMVSEGAGEGKAGRAFNVETTRERRHEPLDFSSFIAPSQYKYYITSLKNNPKGNLEMFHPLESGISNFKEEDEKIKGLLTDIYDIASVYDGLFVDKEITLVLDKKYYEQGSYKFTGKEENFAHLLGLKYLDKDGKVNAKEFYEKCFNMELDTQNIWVSNNIGVVVGKINIMKNLEGFVRETARFIQDGSVIGKVTGSEWLIKQDDNKQKTLGFMLSDGTHVPFTIQAIRKNKIKHLDKEKGEILNPIGIFSRDLETNEYKVLACNPSAYEDTEKVLDEVNQAISLDKQALRAIKEQEIQQEETTQEQTYEEELGTEKYQEIYQKVFDLELESLQNTAWVDKALQDENKYPHTWGADWIAKAKLFTEASNTQQEELLERWAKETTTKAMQSEEALKNTVGAKLFEELFQEEKEQEEILQEQENLPPKDLLALFKKGIQTLRNGSPADKIRYITQAKHFAHLPVATFVLIYEQDSSVSDLRTFEEWKKVGRSVERGQHGLQVLENYKDPNSKRITLFDVRQTVGKELKATQEILSREELDTSVAILAGKDMDLKEYLDWKVDTVLGHNSALNNEERKLISIVSELQLARKFSDDQWHDLQDFMQENNDKIQLGNVLACSNQLTTKTLEKIEKIKDLVIQKMNEDYSPANLIDPSLEKLDFSEPEEQEQAIQTSENHDFNKPQNNPNVEMKDPHAFHERLKAYDLEMLEQFFYQNAYLLEKPFAEIQQIHMQNPNGVLFQTVYEWQQMGGFVKENNRPAYIEKANGQQEILLDTTSIQHLKEDDTIEQWLQSHHVNLSHLDKEMNKTKIFSDWQPNQSDTHANVAPYIRLKLHERTQEVLKDYSKVNNQEKQLVAEIATYSVLERLGIVDKENTQFLASQVKTGIQETIDLPDVMKLANNLAGKTLNEIEQALQTEQELQNTKPISIIELEKKWLDSLQEPTLEQEKEEPTKRESATLIDDIDWDKVEEKTIKEQSKEVTKEPVTDFEDDENELEM